MRRWIIAVMLLLVGVAVWQLSIATMAAPPVQPTPDIDTTTSPQPAPPAAVEAATHTTREAMTTEEADAAPPPLPPDAPSIEVTIVDGETGAPVAGAEVRWTGAPQDERLLSMPAWQRALFAADPDQLQDRFGWRATSDAAGHVRITLSDTAAVIARADDRYGRANFHVTQAWEPPPHLLQLHRDRTLLVHVRDAAGNDAEGVRVACVGFDAATGEPPPLRMGTEQHTDAHGLARFQHLQQRRDGAAPDFAVALFQPGTTLEPVVIPAAELPTQPIELTLPATGSLSVRLRFAGKPFARNDQVSLHEHLLTRRNAANQYWSRSADADGWIHFAHLPLGRTWALQPELGWRGDLKVAGPVTAGEHVRADLDLAELVYAIEGRLLRPDGTPVADTYVHADHDFGILRGLRGMNTDADGRLLWLLGPPLDGETAALRHLDFRLQTDQGLLNCSVAPRALTIGSNDLGEQRFGLGELLVAGRFDFGDAAPTRIWYHVWHLAPDREPNDEAAWQPYHQAQETMNAQAGTFEVRGKVQPGRYRLALTPMVTLPQPPIEFLPGTKDLVVPVRLGAQLEASCMLPDGVEAAQLRLRLQRQAPTAPADQAQYGRHPLIARPLKTSEGRGHYRWPNLEPGTYTLHVECQAAAEAVLEIADVVLPQPPAGDPRLVDIDLDTRLQLVTLRVQKEGAESLPTSQTVVFALPQGGADDWTGCAVDTSEVLLPLPASAAELLVGAAGFRPVTLPVTTQLAATLRPWPTCDVHFTDLVVPEGARLRVGTRSSLSVAYRERRFWFGNNSRPLSSLLEADQRAEADADGHAEVPCSAGTAELVAEVAIGQRAMQLQQVTPREITAWSSITVQLSNDEIARCVEELRRLRQGR